MDEVFRNLKAGASQIKQEVEKLVQPSRQRPPLPARQSQPYNQQSPYGQQQQFQSQGLQYITTHPAQSQQYPPSQSHQYGQPPPSLYSPSPQLQQYPSQTQQFPPQTHPHPPTSPLFQNSNQQHQQPMHPQMVQPHQMIPPQAPFPQYQPQHQTNAASAAYPQAHNFFQPQYSSNSPPPPHQIHQNQPHVQNHQYQAQYQPNSPLSSPQLLNYVQPYYQPQPPQLQYHQNPTSLQQSLLPTGSQPHIPVSLQQSPFPTGSPQPQFHQNLHPPASPHQLPSTTGFPPQSQLDQQLQSPTSLHQPLPAGFHPHPHPQYHHQTSPTHLQQSQALTSLPPQYHSSQSQQEQISYQPQPHLQSPSSPITSSLQKNTQPQPPPTPVQPQERNNAYSPLESQPQTTSLQQNDIQPQHSIALLQVQDGIYHLSEPEPQPSNPQIPSPQEKETQSEHQPPQLQHIPAITPLQSQAQDVFPPQFNPKLQLSIQKHDIQPQSQPPQLQNMPQVTPPQLQAPDDSYLQDQPTPPLYSTSTHQQNHDTILSSVSHPHSQQEYPKNPQALLSLEPHLKQHPQHFRAFLSSELYLQHKQNPKVFLSTEPHLHQNTTFTASSLPQHQRPLQSQELGQSPVSSLSRLSLHSESPSNIPISPQSPQLHFQGQIRNSIKRKPHPQQHAFSNHTQPSSPPSTSPETQIMSSISSPTRGQHVSQQYSVSTQPYQNPTDNSCIKLSNQTFIAELPGDTSFPHPSRSSSNPQQPSPTSQLSPVITSSHNQLNDLPQSTQSLVRQPGTLQPQPQNQSHIPSSPTQTPPFSSPLPLAQPHGQVSERFELESAYQQIQQSLLALPSLSSPDSIPKNHSQERPPHTISYPSEPQPQCYSLIPAPLQTKLSDAQSTQPLGQAIQLQSLDNTSIYHSQSQYLPYSPPPQTQQRFTMAGTISPSHQVQAPSSSHSQTHQSQRQPSQSSPKILPQSQTIYQAYTPTIKNPVLNTPPTTTSSMNLATIPAKSQIQSPYMPYSQSTLSQQQLPSNEPH